ncbi:radical SAM protein [Oligoflexaceae bacterium]|nr:radical SAM protein [Oligoflexaceae bacterium]
MSTPKVLILTGGYITPSEKSAWAALRKQVSQWRKSQHSWLEMKVKGVTAEPYVHAQLERRKSKSAAVKNYFAHSTNFSAPELTEVVIATELKRAGIPHQVSTLEELFRSRKNADAKLNSVDCLFISTTLLRDLSELEPVIDYVKRPHLKIVVGGALTSIMGEKWNGHKDIDLVAVGYGEIVIEKIAEWIKSEYKAITAPERGRLAELGLSTAVFSGVPEKRNLDFLPTPDWGHAEKIHGKRFSMIHYESVRGCPYRCAFCNYPNLFDDGVFRFKSAQRMADEWEHYYKDLGVEYITCLDSLFTMPKKRLIDFCKELIKREIKIKWICYARAAHLCDDEVVLLMKQAGVVQVQIGIESGSDRILQNMSKYSTTDENALGLQKCREHGITSVVTLIVGFPGETRQTVQQTLRFMKENPADFFFVATFSTRVVEVPILTAANRKEFGLWTMENPYSVSPYWIHNTMRCDEAGELARYLQQEIIKQRASLDAAIFYGGILEFDPLTREELLNFQKRALLGHPVISLAFKVFNKFVDWCLKRDLDKFEQTRLQSLESLRSPAVKKCSV